MESIVADHLIRFRFNLNPRDPFDPRDEIFFYPVKKTEIDFVVNMDNYCLPIEVKNRNDVPSSAVSTVRNYAKEYGINGLIISKEYKKYDNVLSIPASLFLALI